MFRVYIKGCRHHSDADMVKLTMVFYRTGYARVTKVLSLSGLYRDWNPKTRSFQPTTPENISKNKLLQRERIKYLNLAERWECSGKNWLPVELSHYFDRKSGHRNHYKTVSQVFDEVIEYYTNRKRIRNGKLFTGAAKANHLKYTKRSLERFSQNKYGRAFSNYHFRDINEKFLIDYTTHEQSKISRAGTYGGVCTKLTSLLLICKFAKTKGVYNVDTSVFSYFQSKLQPRKFFSKAVTHQTILHIESIDRSLLKKHEKFYLDLFLFSYYAAGMSGIDICHMQRSWIKGHTIEYDRTKYDNSVRVILTEKAEGIMSKYLSESYMDYVFPIFKKKEQSVQSRYNRVHYVTKSVNDVLRKVCLLLKIEDRITWSTARSSFITTMLDEGFHVMQVAEQTGNTPQTISKHYYAITNKEEFRKRMNSVFS